MPRGRPRAVRAGRGGESRGRGRGGAFGRAPASRQGVDVEDNSHLSQNDSSSTSGQNEDTNEPRELVHRRGVRRRRSPSPELGSHGHRQQSANGQRGRGGRGRGRNQDAVVAAASAVAEEEEQGGEDEQQNDEDGQVQDVQPQQVHSNFSV